MLCIIMLLSCYVYYICKKVKWANIDSGVNVQKYVTNFDPPKVVGRGSETQLQVGENFTYRSSLK